MFKSIYLQGFARPVGGVRTIIDLLLKQLDQTSAQVQFRCEVEQILLKDKKAIGVRTKEGEEFYAKQIFSSIGLPETYQVTAQKKEHAVGELTFAESIIMTSQKINPKDHAATISFYNDSDEYKYRSPTAPVDTSSAVICIPDNYDLNNRAGEGCFRVTYMAHQSFWHQAQALDYKEGKAAILNSSIELLKRQVKGFNQLKVVASDVFTPRTITKYTSHLRGVVYGSTDKSRDGKTAYENLYVIGTDQGFLGIVGSILSGISIGNLYGLSE